MNSIFHLLANRRRKKEGPRKKGIEPRRKNYRSKHVKTGEADKTKRIYILHDGHNAT